MGCGFCHIIEKETNGLFGFNNIDGECFINSTLQIFTHLNTLNEKINKYIDTNLNKEENCYKEKFLLIEYKKILELINKQEKVINSINIKKAMSKINYLYNNSNSLDANDFITDFIIEMSNELPSPRNNKLKIPINKIEQNSFKKLIKKFYKNESFIMDMFFGIKKTEILCTNNHIINVQYDNFIILELSVYPFREERIINIKDILKFNFKESQFFNICDECQKESECIKKIKIYNAPDILIIYFGRTIDNKFYDNKIVFENIINMNEFTNSIEKFSLFGLIQNIKGHYSSCTINQTIILMIMIKNGIFLMIQKNQKKLAIRKFFYLILFFYFIRKND